MATKYKYNAFLSYSWDDREIAEKLHDDIENSAKLLKIIPRLKIFKDQNDANNKMGLDEIYKGLDESEHLIILASPNSANSKNCGDEIKYWIEQKRGLKNIKIILLKGKITIQEKIIEVEKQYILVSTSLHPVIQATLFKHRPIWTNLSTIENLAKQDRNFGFYRANLLEIVAYILNTTSRNIEGKESRARWTVYFLAITFVIVVGFFGWFAYDNANEAERQKKKAEMERDTAQNNLRRFEFERLKESIRNAQIFKDAGGYGQNLALEELQTADTLLWKNKKHKAFTEKKTEINELKRTLK